MIQTNELQYVFREDITSALGCFLVDPLSWSNWNLEVLVFVKGDKT